MKIGFIGAGNMGGAIIGGYVKKNPQEAENVYISEHGAEKSARVAAAMGVNACSSVEELVEAADMIVLAVKPNMFGAVLPQVREAIEKGGESKLIVSIAAGITIEDMETALPEGTQIVRTMPNTPALVNEGMTAVCPADGVDQESLNAVLELFGSCGKAEVVKESLIEAVVGVSGSSPAYVYMFIEALADAAVAEGMPRAKAYQFAGQAVLGSAKMVLESGMHPGALKDAVCSPGGSTIEAVMALEKSGLRAAVMEGSRICSARAREMAQKK